MLKAAALICPRRVHLPLDLPDLLPSASCQSLERGPEGAGRHIYIPRTREALTCWGYMQAMQDLSVLADEEGHRIMGACPPEQTTTLQLIQSFVRYARAHRSELQGNAVVAVFRALREAYPCRAERRLKPSEH